MFFENLYIHFPFCLSKCRHCSFVSSPVKSEKDVSFYFQLLEKELKIFYSLFPGQSLATVYLGGGTPSLLPPSMWAYFLDLVNRYFPLSSSCEVSFEANPQDIINPHYLKDLKLSGVNRISVGWQSSFSEDLLILGRNRCYSSLSEIIGQVNDAGFFNVGIDLIYGLPGQTLKQWADNLLEAINAHPNHISVYGLHLEEELPLANLLQKKIVPALPGEESLRKMLLVAKSLLVEAGYHHYEIANYAQPGFQCCHNLSYWKNKPYLALGPGAHGYLLNCRYHNKDNIMDYGNDLFSSRLPWGHMKRISLKDAVEEEMFLGLRLLEGVDRNNFKKKYGLGPHNFFADSILRLQKKELLEVTKEKIMITDTGLPLANLVFQEFIT